MKIKENSVFNLFLMAGRNSFNKYLTDTVKIKYNLHIDKNFFIPHEKLSVESGKIFIVEETLKAPSWINTINQLKRGRNGVELEARLNWTALVFLRLKEEKQTLLLTFGRVSGMLNESYIIKNFGMDTSKQMVDSQRLKQVKIQSFDERQTRIQKESIRLLNENYLINPFELSSIHSFLGNTEIDDLQISMGGTNGLRINGNLNFKEDLLNIIYSLLISYSNKDKINPKFNVHENINPVTEDRKKNQLNKLLHDKLERIFRSDDITGNSVKNLSINPFKNFITDDFLGYKFTGLGFPTSKKFTDDDLDIVYLFDRIKRSLSVNDRKKRDLILHKLKNIKVKIFYGEEKEYEEKSFFNSLYFEAIRDHIKYIFTDGKWYKINNNFYQLISEKISEIPTNQALEYPDYNTLIHDNENDYNEKLAKKTCTLSLDCTRYRPNKEVRTLAQISPQSNVELADIINYDSNEKTIQFIHIKKLYSNANQTIHSFTQAKSAAQIYAYDKHNVECFINAERKEGNFSLIPFSKINRVEIIVCLILPSSKIDKVSNHKKLFTILERISLYETINIIRPLGFNFKLNFIKSNI